jgi:hypothetical protein
MGLTPKEKQARYRERLRRERPGEYLQQKEKDRERHQRNWKKNRSMMSIEEYEDHLKVQRVAKKKRRVAQNGCW